MSAPNTPTFVIFPGHWHTTAHLLPLTKALDARSIPSKTVQLYTVGRKPAIAGVKPPRYSDDVSVIYAGVVQELFEGRDVVLVLHSYAGIPGAEAVNRLIKDGVVEGVSTTRPDSGVQVPEPEEDETPSKPMGSLVRIVFIAAHILPAKFLMDPKDYVGPDNPGFTIDVRPCPVPDHAVLILTHNRQTT